MGQDDRPEAHRGEVLAVVTPHIFEGDLRHGESRFAGQGFSGVQPPDPVGDVLTPADHDGASAPPPAGAPGVFMRHRDDEIHNPGANDPTRDFLEIWQLKVDFAVPANSVLSGPTNLAVTEFDSTLCGQFSFSCFAQPGTGVRLDPLREVIMRRLQHRVFGTRRTLVGNFVTDVNGADHGGIRWFILLSSGGTWTLFQEGTFAPDSDNRWMGSAAMDKVANLVMGYNVSSSSTFPSLRLSGRKLSSPAGTLPLGERTVALGTASNTSNRYGDYSSMNVDPVDDCTFWFTGEYNPAPQWATDIASIKLSNCN